MRKATSFEILVNYLLKMFAYPGHGRGGFSRPLQKKFSICWLFRLQCGNHNVREVAMGQPTGQMLICELFMLSFGFLVAALLFCCFLAAQLAVAGARINCCRF